MRRWKLAAAVLVLAGPAHAQTTTRCGWEGAQWVCRSDAPRPNPITEGLNAGISSQRNLQEQGRQAQANIDRLFSEARRRQAGEAVAAGNCDEARRIALRGGDFELTQQIETVCRGR